MKKYLFVLALASAALVCGCNAPEQNLSELYSWSVRSDIYTVSIGEEAVLTITRSDGEQMPAADCRFRATDQTLYSSNRLTFDAVGVYQIAAAYASGSREYACSNTVTIQVVDTPVAQIERKPYMWTNPMGEKAPALEVAMEQKVVFTDGTPADYNEDKRFYLDFPDDTSLYGRVILVFTMCGDGNGPGSWDQSEQFFVKDKSSGQWFQILSAITPYGSGFRAGWQKVFYLDVTEYLPLLHGHTEFRCFGGGPTEANRWHATHLAFDFYDTVPQRRTVWMAKMYDSGENPSTWHSRSWRYGVADIDIEAPERMGLRSFTVPNDVREVELRYSVTGHGADNGVFPARPDYDVANRGCAEFSENFYRFKLNGRNLGDSVVGRMYFDNMIENYDQYGMSHTPRSSWGPGLPVNIQYWAIKEIPADRNLTLDIDLDEFITADSYSQYIVNVDLFGYK